MSRRTARFLTVLLAGAGTMHFAVPGTFDQIVPPRLPGSPRAYTYASGVAELAVAGLITLPRTRRLGGAAAAALFVAVFPANVQMAADWRRRSPPWRAVADGRLPLQAVLVAQAVRVARGPR
ncbi:DoxX family protein [Georgenia sp. Z1491]|uniref:DoxX family protein n=1 Tax=Georgenia sp. Z1491 TaxID=3416707 RepID=UPI003CEAF215